MPPAASSAGVDFHHHGGAVGLPAVLLLAGPLQAHRAARHRPRQQRRVGGGIVGAVVAVAAGALGMDAAHLLLRHPHHLGDGVAVRIDALRMGPDRQRVVVELRHRAGRPDRAVRQIRARVSGVMCVRAGEPGLPVENRDVLRLQPHQHGRQRVDVRQFRALLPSRRRRERAHRLYRLEFALGDDAEEAAVAHDLEHAGHFLDRGSCRPRRAWRRNSAAAPRGRGPCRPGASPAHRRRRPSLWRECRRAGCAGS